MLPLIVSLDNADDSGVPDHIQGPLTNEKKLEWRSTASVTAKLLLSGISDSADASDLLKSVAGNLCFILENREVWPSSPIRYPQSLLASQRMKANEQAIESLAPRINAVSALLRTPASGGDVREQLRRRELKR